MMLLCMVRRVKEVVAIVFHSALSSKTEPGVRAAHNDAGVFGQWTMETLASYKNVGGKVLYCLSFLEASKNKLCVLLSWRSTERRAHLLLTSEPARQHPMASAQHYLQKATRQTCLSNEYLLSL